VWINPSPAIANINCVRTYTGTVLLEGTNLSEGRGTTTPLEVVGAPRFPVEAVLSKMRALAPEWCEGCYLRPCFFEPFFDKYTRTLCAGVQIHADFPGYVPHRFRPYRLISALFKAGARTARLPAVRISLNTSPAIACPSTSSTAAGAASVGGRSGIDGRLGWRAAPRRDAWSEERQPIDLSIRL
jgi:hypothetical protein